jgi:hypothetical protein
VDASFGAGAVPGRRPNTKAGTRCIHRLGDVTGGLSFFATGRRFPWQDNGRGREQDCSGRRTPVHAQP